MLNVWHHILAQLVASFVALRISVKGATIVDKDRAALTEQLLRGTPFHIMSEQDRSRKTTNLHRNAIKDPSKKWWSKTIPYVFASDFNSAHRAIIEKAHREIESSSCVRFVPRAYEWDYIEYVSKAGCNAVVGRQGGRQEVSLQVPVCLKQSIAVHETLHALGFYHEQSRSDRDQYIRVNLDNVIPQYRFAYQIEDTNNLNTPYDYGSIMHYSTTYFAMDLRKPTMVALTPGKHIARSSQMTLIDKQRVNSLYQCDPSIVIDTLPFLTEGCAPHAYHVASENGSTCAKMAGICGITLVVMLSINPKLQNGTRCEKPLPEGTPICCRLDVGVTDQPTTTNVVTMTTTTTEKTTSLPIPRFTSQSVTVAVGTSALRPLGLVTTTTTPKTESQPMQRPASQLITVPIGTTTRPPLAILSTGCDLYWGVNNALSAADGCRIAAQVCGLELEALFRLNAFLNGGKSCNLATDDVICCRHQAGFSGPAVSMVSPLLLWITICLCYHPTRCAPAAVAAKSGDPRDSLSLKSLPGTPFHILSEAEHQHQQTNAVQRNAHRDPNKRWPHHIVPYLMPTEFDAAQRTVIEKAHREIESGTCIRFKSHTIEPDYIQYTAKWREGCHADIGRQGGRQEVNLEAPGCVHQGVVIHETLHALGFYHEQNRSDRDEYIAIDYSNIIPIHRHNFKKEPTRNLNTPYDFNSIMHYGSNHFAVDPAKPTMISQKAGTKIAPSRNHMSKIDRLRVNLLYHCSGSAVKQAS
ncbi:putative High choriolytic enzyme 1 [Hypsibius exemplaris]|uniref:Metalloendopeptidase n=1 Tax=Hypsibius exemplaris TaxID=2072580 RepID=A0A1W0WWU5_HYPEX|nr:putative High choriolytic enzyme 1 [Hypsibius exemplaris]